MLWNLDMQPEKEPRELEEEVLEERLLGWGSENLNGTYLPLGDHCLYSSSFLSIRNHIFEEF